MATTLLDEIIQRRQQEAMYDQELWSFMYEVSNRPLMNISDDTLQLRLAQLEKNIQFLDFAPSKRDKLSHNIGWMSPWWWLRQRFFTIKEFEERGLSFQPRQEFEPFHKVRKEFWGHHYSGPLKLFRISRIEWLLEALEYGRLRFAPASSYNATDLSDARSDEELTKHTFIPKHSLTMIHESGNELRPLGDVRKSVFHGCQVGLNPITVPYWLTSYSSILDPRLLNEFSSVTGDDGFLAVFDAFRMVRQSAPVFSKDVPYLVPSMAEVEYFDPYFPSHNKIKPAEAKDMRFAYQREVRMILQPEVLIPESNEEAIFLDIGSIAEYAAVYAANGKRIAGTGPENFMS